MGVKEQYWKYSLVVILLLLGVVIFWEITPFLGGYTGSDDGLYFAPGSDDISFRTPPYAS